MSRIISLPPGGVEQLQPGERRALSFFDRHLPQAWEIYAQPHLNGLRPDFVLLHPRAGIAVFEIKDWNLDAMRYFTRQVDGIPLLWREDRNGKQFPVRDEPVAKAVRYKQEILDLYCPRLGLKACQHLQAEAVVTAGVIVPTATTSRICELLHPIREWNGLLSGRMGTYHPLAGGDALDSGDIAAVFPWGRNETSRWIDKDDDFASDLRTWLVGPDHANEQGKPLLLNADQRKLATTRTPSGFRRVRGPAGSGKSLALAARAAHLSAEGKQVLVVSFNLTLLHYLRDLAVRYPDRRSSNTSQITWLHFHGWCKRVCEEAGMEHEYRRIWRRGGHVSTDDPQDGLSDSVWDRDLPALADKAISAGEGDVSTYDGIFVDEGQDYLLEWWNLLRRVLRPGGEMMLAADKTQDLYRRSSRWTDASLEGAGFQGGNWFNLGGSYRFPPELVPLLRSFVSNYLPNTDVDLPTTVPSQGEFFSSVHMKWIQVPDCRLIEESFQAIRQIALSADPAVPWSDITLLVQHHRTGSECVEELESQGVKVCHVFGATPTEKK